MVICKFFRINRVLSLMVFYT